MLTVMGGNSASTGYNLTNSLRFRSSASASLSRTPASAGNRQKWTWSGWIKRGALGSNSCFFSQGNNIFVARFNSSTDVLEVYDVTGGPYQLQLITSQVFRDPSSWYHLVISTDTTQATSSNRVKLYINGSQITAFSTATYYSQNYNTAVNTTSVTNIGALAFVGQYFDGYVAEINFIDGQALTPSSFGSYSSTTGVWQPALYTGTYGTNGFYLPFTDNSALTTSSNVGLGKDFSGNGNYWTTNNISITAGTTYDSMTDVPTLTSATASNFCVLNPLWRDYGNGTPAIVTGLSNGNLRLVFDATAWDGYRSTISVNSGKWYVEVNTTTGGANAGSCALEVLNISTPVNTSGGVVTITPASSGQTIAIALDLDAGSYSTYRNNSVIGTGSITLGITYCFRVRVGNGPNAHINFGQRPFTYTPPTGYVALNTFNLPTSTIVKGDTVMDATLYTGTGASQTIANAAGFKPDLVWAKSRSAATDHAWYDSVRGTTKQLESNTTDAETTQATGVTAFGSTGFTVGSLAQMNTNTATYVAWQWQAGQGTNTTNTSGSITSTVSVNASAGFSIATYTGTGAAATVGHGLGVAPKWIIVKSRSAAGQDWRVYTETVGNTGVMTLNSDGAAVTGQSGFWNNTSPTSSVFSVGSAASTNGNGTTYVAYCWTPIAGYSAFDSYTGNGSTNGPFVYTGFRPKWIIFKNRTTSTTLWIMYDTARQTYNVMNRYLTAESAGAEATAPSAIVDILSNGFKLRGTSTNTNTSGDTYIYAAFAENPTKYALAR